MLNEGEDVHVKARNRRSVPKKIVDLTSRGSQIHAIAFGKALITSDSRAYTRRDEKELDQTDLDGGRRAVRVRG